MGPSSGSPTTYPRGPTDAGTPVCPGDARHETQPSHRACVSVLTLVSCLPELTKGAPARRQCRTIAGAVAESAVLPLALPLAACGPPSGTPESGTLLILSPRPFAHRLSPPWLRLPTPRQRPVRGSGITGPLAST
jgi:hypothetical protein